MESVDVGEEGCDDSGGIIVEAAHQVVSRALSACAPQVRWVFSSKQINLTRVQVSDVESRLESGRESGI